MRIPTLFVLTMLALTACTHQREVASCDDCKEGETCVPKTIEKEGARYTTIKCVINKEPKNYSKLEKVIGTVESGVNKSKSAVNTCKAYCPFGTNDSIVRGRDT